ncbi:MAG TPA: ECF-type sigma factor [Terriglobia bacterium]|nr:ECF-type sigma factor [Terriglobia bacterium]
MSRFSSKSISELLKAWQAGDEEALAALLPLVYNELRRLARRHLRTERSDHTLESAALVNEVYLRMIRQKSLHVENRTRFLAVSAHLMRQVLVEYGRYRRAAKRDAGRKITLDGVESLLKDETLDLMALDEALKDLARLDPKQAQIVELRYFAGLTTEEIADVLEISPATVKREWATARVWLHHYMSGTSEVVR